MTKILFILGLLCLLAGTSRAVPPFARRYGMSCSTCHVGGPTKLSGFGEAFRDNGYRIPGDDEAYLRESPVPLGAQARAGLFPRTVWPGWLPASLPLGVSGRVGVVGTIQPASSAERSTLGFPADIALLAGGSFGRHLSFFGVIEGGTSGIAVSQLFVTARSLFERWLGETHLNLKVGRMDLDLTGIQPRLRRSFTPFLPLELSVGRDRFALGQPDQAIEIYGLLAGRVKWLIGAANGAKPLDDTGSRRDLFGRLSLKLGGPRLDYKNVTLGASEGTAVNLGASVYWGVGAVNPAPPEQRFRNDIGRLEADLRLRTHGLDLYGAVVLGSDGNPDGTGVEVRHVAWLAELDYEVFPWLQPYARFEEARFDSAAHLDRRRVVVGSAIFIRANLRFRAEGVVGLVDNEPHQVLADLFFAM